MRIDFESWDESASAVSEMPDTDWGVYGQLTIPPIRFFIPLEGDMPARDRLRENLWRAALEYLMPLPAPSGAKLSLELTPLLRVSVESLVGPR